MENEIIKKKYQKLQKKLEYENRQLFKKQLGSNSRKKKELEILKLKNKIKNFRSANNL